MVRCLLHSLYISLSFTDPALSISSPFTFMLPFLLSPLLLLLSGRDAHSLSVPISLQAPEGAVTLDPALLSFSIEQDRWTDWAGLDAPNTFLLNALDNLKQRTGQLPWIRIGADSEDHTNFRADIQVNVRSILVHSSRKATMHLSPIGL